MSELSSVYEIGNCRFGAHVFRDVTLGSLGEVTTRCPDRPSSVKWLSYHSVSNQGEPNVRMLENIRYEYQSRRIKI